MDVWVVRVVGTDVRFGHGQNCYMLKIVKIDSNQVETFEIGSEVFQG